METDEIYDILTEQLLRAIRGYDPGYKAKVKLVVEAINEGLSKRRQFTAADVNRHLDIDSSRYLRLLVRVGFLQKTEEGWIRTGLGSPGFFCAQTWRGTATKRAMTSGRAFHKRR